MRSTHREFKLFKLWASEGTAAVRAYSLGDRFVDEITDGVQFTPTLVRPQVDGSGKWHMVEDGHTVDPHVEQKLYGAAKIDLSTRALTVGGVSSGERDVVTAEADVKPASSSTAMIIGGVLAVAVVGFVLFRKD